MTQYHFTPETYETMIAADVPAYSRLQHALVVVVQRSDRQRGPVSDELAVLFGVTAVLKGKTMP